MKISPVAGSLFHEKEQFDGLLFDVGNMRAIREALKPWLSIEAAAEKLNYRPDTVRELIRLHLLVTDRTEVDSKAFWRIDPDSVAKFAQRYVRGSDYAEAFRTTGDHASRRLIFLGVKPVVDMTLGYQTAIFKRDEVERTIRGLATHETWTTETRALFWRQLGRTLESRGSPYVLDHDYKTAAVLSLFRTGVMLVVRYQKSRNSVAVGIQINSFLDPSAFDILRGQKNEIESELGFKLSWIEHEARTGVCCLVENMEFALSDRANWPKLHAWVADVLPRFREVFRPRVKNLPGRFRPKVKGMARWRPENEPARVRA
jgi:hypothetical protein